MVEIARLNQGFDAIMEEAAKIRMGILADNRLLEELLAIVLSNRYHRATIAGSALTLEDYLQLLQKWVFDVGIAVLSDEWASSDTMTRLWQKSPRTRTLIVVGQIPDARLHNLMQETHPKIQWLVNKNSGVEEIMKALVEIEQNQSYIDPTIMMRLTSTFLTPKPDGLTEREQQVLALLADGYKNFQIAQQLCITEHTVKSHTSNLFHKIGVTSRQEATAYAWKQGLVKTNLLATIETMPSPQKPYSKKR